MFIDHRAPLATLPLLQGSSYSLAYRNALCAYLFRSSASNDVFGRG